MTHSGVAAGVMLCASLLAVWPAAAAPKRGDRVSIVACPVAGITGNCLMIRDAAGTVYNITSASPRPPLGGRMIRLRGTVTDRLSICGQGVVLDRIRWTRTRQSCPK